MKMIFCPRITLIYTNKETGINTFKNFKRGRNNFELKMFFCHEYTNFTAKDAKKETDINFRSYPFTNENEYTL
jgi:hypothetical protein